jgi:hypothetical protein
MKKESHLYRWVPGLSSCGSVHNVGLFHLKKIFQVMLLCVHSHCQKKNNLTKAACSSLLKNLLTRLVENPPNIDWKAVG